jgi:hypothetical protein
VLARREMEVVANNEIIPCSPPPPFSSCKTAAAESRLESPRLAANALSCMCRRAPPNTSSLHQDAVGASAGPRQHPPASPAATCVSADATRSTTLRSGTHEDARHAPGHDRPDASPANNDHTTRSQPAARVPPQQPATPWESPDSSEAIVLASQRRSAGHNGSLTRRGGEWTPAATCCSRCRRSSRNYLTGPIDWPAPAEREWPAPFARSLSINQRGIVACFV